jgi:hypothetical protein
VRAALFFVKIKDKGHTKKKSEALKKKGQHRISLFVFNKQEIIAAQGNFGFPKVNNKNSIFSITKICKVGDYF